MKVYIAGPMSGLPELNYPAFRAEAWRLRALGHEVVSPAELNPQTGKSWAECMRLDIHHLATCDALQTLPGWQRSPGATFEVQTATILELEVWHGQDAAERRAP